MDENLVGALELGNYPSDFSPPALAAPKMSRATCLMRMVCSSTKSSIRTKYFSVFRLNVSPPSTCRVSHCHLAIVDHTLAAMLPQQCIGTGEADNQVVNSMHFRSGCPPVLRLQADNVLPSHRALGHFVNFLQDFEEECRLLAAILVEVCDLKGDGVQLSLHRLGR